jgi:hypothetical protein
MSKLIIGFVFGLIVATVGFSGVARIMDHGIATVKSQAQTLAQ